MLGRMGTDALYKYHLRDLFPGLFIDVVEAARRDTDCAALVLNPTMLQLINALWRARGARSRAWAILWYVLFLLLFSFNVGAACVHNSFPAWPQSAALLIVILRLLIQEILEARAQGFTAWPATGEQDQLRIDLARWKFEEEMRVAEDNLVEVFAFGQPPHQVIKFSCH